MKPTKMSGRKELESKVDGKEYNVQQNIAKWQSIDNSLAALSENQLDVIYQMKDMVQEHCFWSSNTGEKRDETNNSNRTSNLPIINTNRDYILWMTETEKQMKLDGLNDYVAFYNRQKDQAHKCELLFTDINNAVKSIEQLHIEYQQVTSKTDSLHSLSERLLSQQNELKSKRNIISDRLYYFRLYQVLLDNIAEFDNSINPEVYIDTSDKIDQCIEYFKTHSNFRESKSYIAKFENLFSKCTILVRKYFNNVIGSAMNQVTNPTNKANLVSSGNPEDIENGESAFSLYYGTFLSAAVKVKPIMAHVETKVDNNNNSYQQLLYDCQQIYFVQRSPIMTDAVNKALKDLKTKHKNDHSVLFRSIGLFIMQVCQDEASCFKYFFNQHSQQLDEYFGILCQSAYDILRPCLIGIYHLEVLTELCGILRGEMLTSQIQSNSILDKFVEIIQQLLEDVEERLVFRSHIFFQNDLLMYKPSPGDLAYPEKLEQMEHVTEEIEELGSESFSVLPRDSQDVENIQLNKSASFRSYTGNSPADLHGMWYPTVKRTLVCLSRLYFCLDTEIFQGLAHEALAICVETITEATRQITARKSAIDGQLFQVKHLLILREQIAPFQVDFTVKTIGLDFSNVKPAAVSLIKNSDKLFTFSSNNALLEFLLEGTPRVKEYLVDSRKEIDKQLKISCEVLISRASSLLVGNLMSWIHKVNNCLNGLTEKETDSLVKQDFAKPKVLANLINTARKNIKVKVPEIQRSLQLYLANKETEFILFRPIKNNIVKTFIHVEQIISTAKYSYEDHLMVACPTPEQINILICSVSLLADHDRQFKRSSSRTSISEPLQRKDSKNLETTQDNSK